MGLFGMLGKALVGGAVVAAGAALYMNRGIRVVYVPLDSLKNTNILITGATAGLGLESAKRLAAGGANVILTARSEPKGQAAVQAVLDYDNNIDKSQLSYQVLDMDDLNSVRAAKDWDIDQIDVLLNNAGIMALPDRQLTRDGYEQQMQANHIGHFLLTAVLSPKLSDTARIINVSSEGHKMAAARGGLNFAYMWKGEPGYNGWISYGQSKLANIYFAQELQRKVDASQKRWQVASLHPGTVNTDLARNVYGAERLERIQTGTEKNVLWVWLFKIFAMFIQTVQTGANTHVCLAAGLVDGNKTLAGDYYVRCKKQKLWQVAQDAEAAARLWRETERIVGVTFDPSATTDTVTSTS